jgi:hypothetical protein
VTGLVRYNLHQLHQLLDSGAADTVSHAADAPEPGTGAGLAVLLMYFSSPVFRAEVEGSGWKQTPRRGRDRRVSMERRKVRQRGAIQNGG